MIAEAARVLSGLGLVTAFGHVSQRAGAGLLMTPAADLTEVGAADLIEVRLGVSSLPAGAPAEAWAHLRVYAARPDVMAIARAQPPAGFAAAAALGPAPAEGDSASGRGSAARAAEPASDNSNRRRRSPDLVAGPGSGRAAKLPLLYGQACWLGERVPVHPDGRLLRTAALADAAAATLGRDHALLLRGNGALTCGPAPGLAVTRMWLLEMACRTWLTAAAAGPVSPMPPVEAASWRAVEAELLPRLWRHLSRAQGQAAAADHAAAGHTAATLT
jgi:HCOMODA/2-hydroxy-3-carboxy-muconic semialdehyde decarboxylase